MRKWLNKHSLSTILLILFIISWLLQLLFTIPVSYNEATAHGESFAWKEFWPEFLKDTFENWQSEFLQVLVFVVFTKYFREEGSPESK